MPETASVDSGGLAQNQRHPQNPGAIRNMDAMLQYAIVFLIVALIAAFLGFGGIAGTAAWIAKVLFFVFLILFLVSLFTGRRPGV